MLGQSQALTTLVNQIATSQQDPLADLASSSTSASTRGAVGRAKLQAELALHKVNTSSWRCFSRCRSGWLRPLIQKPAPSHPFGKGDLRNSLPGKVRWLWKAEGVGTSSMASHDHSGLSDGREHPSSKNATALLAVTLEQGVMDNGRLDMASLLCLQEEPPASVFSMRKRRRFFPQKQAVCSTG